MTTPARRRAFPDLGIWGFAFGYFAAYVPYSATTKAVTRGLLEGVDTVAGLTILPLSVAASVVGMLTFLVVSGWIKSASHTVIAGVRVPHPTRFTLVSGLGTATIVATTTLAYTFEGVSIVFVMLLMRGGVLILAPVIDALTGRTTRWFSWVGLALSLGALLVAFAEDGGLALTLACVVDIALYLGAYFVRLRLMSKKAKSATDEGANRRYFVEEQLVATPAVLLFLAAFAFLVPGDVASEVRAGFTDIFSMPVWPWVIFIGICSQFTGIFGGLILLDKRENTYCVPVNRSSSIIAGVLASFSLTVLFDKEPPSGYQLAGAALIIFAILFLSVPPLLEKRRARTA